jgi:hypothetical protein
MDQLASRGPTGAGRGPDLARLSGTLILDKLRRWPMSRTISGEGVLHEGETCLGRVAYKIRIHETSIPAPTVSDRTATVRGLDEVRGRLTPVDAIDFFSLIQKGARLTLKFPGGQWHCALQSLGGDAMNQGLELTDEVEVGH